MAVPSVREQNGFVRPLAVSLCQDYLLLLEILEYDYQLSNSLFCEYAEERGVLYKAGDPGSTWWTLLDDWRTTRADFELFCDPSMWLQFNIARGALQDVWEVWRTTR